MEAQLLVVHGKPRGKRLTFPVGEFVFGRGPECHVRPDSPSVSRQHCLLRVTPEEVRLRDLGSTNGTLVNGTLVTGEQLLADGDRVAVGPLVLELRLALRGEPSQDTDLTTLVSSEGATQIIKRDQVPNVTDGLR
ncbi:MAG: FHA domain-containing protein [Gemmataceae bacterium]|nr:FHA domain-containing protein [Gemmataceae bacterium]